MTKNVYNIVWADDEIDDILDDETIAELEDIGFKIVGKAHNGVELAKFLKDTKRVDAVIVDANFNEEDIVINNERDTSGLDYARGLYVHQLNRQIPFFLFTNRSDELLHNIYENNPGFLKDFPRHKRWFSKSGENEYQEMLEQIKSAVDEAKSPSFIIRNRYHYELNAASLFENTEEFIFDFLVHDYQNNIEAIAEPFVSVRRSIEKIFGLCEKIKIIPPISDNTNGTAAYLLYNNYRNEGKIIYEKMGKEIMAKPLAQSLKYIVDITQDASHSKNELKLKVDEYFQDTKDTLLVRSVVYILIDIIKWAALTALNNQDAEINALTLWREVEQE